VPSHSHNSATSCSTRQDAVHISATVERQRIAVLRDNSYLSRQPLRLYLILSGCALPLVLVLQMAIQRAQTKTMVATEIFSPHPTRPVISFQDCLHSGGDRLIILRECNLLASPRQVLWVLWNTSQKATLSGL
jgi:hypothetical protein